MKTEINGNRIKVLLAPGDLITIGYLDTELPIRHVAPAAPKAVAAAPTDEVQMVMDKPARRYNRHYPRHRWTKDDKKELRALAASGYTDKELMKHFNIGKHSLYMAKKRYTQGKYTNHKARPENADKPWDSREVKALLDMTERGCTKAEIAKELHRPIKAVATKLWWIREQHKKQEAAKAAQ